jgi:hypothetical protein
MNAPTTSSSSSSSFIEPKKRKYNEYTYEYEAGYTNAHGNQYEDGDDDTSDCSEQSTAKHDADMIIPDYDIKKEYSECDGSSICAQSHRLTNNSSANSSSHKMNNYDGANGGRVLKNIEFTEWNRENWVDLFDVNKNLM